MVNVKKKLLSFLLSGTLAVSAAASVGTVDTFAAAQCTTYSGSNVNAQDYYKWSSTVRSYLSVCDNGNYIRVQAGAVSGKLLVEYYDQNFNLLSTKLVDNELPVFGAFYDSGDNYYVLSGQNNPNENNSLEVFRITKYDKNWNKIKSCGLYGANTTVPFDAGSARMTHSGDHLLIRTCHEMYQTSDGLNHQANVTIEVDMPSMTITDSYTGVMNVNYGYVSHSFNQFIRTDGNNIVAVDHGDAHPRSAALVKYKTDFTTGKFFPSYYEKGGYMDVVAYPDYAANYNYTGASIGGFEVSSSSYIVAQNTVDLDLIDTSKTRNVYVSAVSRDLSTNTLNKITTYAEGTDSASTPQLVKIDDNNFLLFWARDDEVNYVKLNAEGKMTGSIHSFKGSLSDCQPVIANGRAVWYVWDNGNVTFNSVNVSNLDDHKSVEIQNGHDYETKYASATDGNVTQTCKVCGYVNKFTVPTSTVVYWRTDISATNYWSNPQKTQFEVGDNVDIWPYDNTEYTIELSDNSIAKIEKLSGYVQDIRRLTFKKTGSLSVKIYPTYNPSVARTYNFVCGCVHSYGNSVVTKQPTCTAQGTLQKTCTKCGETVQETIAAKGHSFGSWTTTKAATCTAEGTMTRKCSVCGTVETKTIAKTSHTIVTDKAVAATCTTAGKTEGSHCSVCGAVIKAQTVIAAKGHIFSEWTSKTGATCTTGGTLTRKCTVCGAVETKTIPANQHTIVIDKAVEATCTTAGKTEGSHCSVCGTVIKAQTVIPAKGHSFSDWTTTKAATCTAEGTMTRTCSTCGTVETKTISKTSHTIVTDKAVAATCTAAGKTEGSHCSVCGTVIKVQTVIVAKGHSFGNWTTTKAATCTETGVMTRVCANCGKTETQGITAKGHSWAKDKTVAPTLSAEGYTTYKCKNCQATKKSDIKAKLVNISGAKIGGVSATYYHTGKAIMPSMTLTLNGQKLTKNKDYRLSYSKNVSVGTATVTATGMGKYGGTVKKTFAIKYNFTKASVSSISDKVYAGKAIKPSVTVKYSGKTLKNGTDYTVSYKNNTNTGKATVTITGKGSYSGKKTVTFKIKPKTASISKATTPKAGQLKVEWKKDSQASGYQIFYATDSKFTKNKGTATITKNSTLSKTVSSLKKGTKYYVKVRSYKTIDGKKVYGAYSKALSVTVKK